MTNNLQLTGKQRVSALEITCAVRGYKMRMRRSFLAQAKYFSCASNNKKLLVYVFLVNYIYNPISLC